MPNLLETNQFFWLHSSVFALEKYPENLSFHSFFTSENLWLLLSVKQVHLRLENMQLNKV